MSIEITQITAQTYNTRNCRAHFSVQRSESWLWLRKDESASGSFVNYVDWQILTKKICMQKKLLSLSISTPLMMVAVGQQMSKLLGIENGQCSTRRARCPKSTRTGPFHNTWPHLTLIYIIWWNIIISHIYMQTYLPPHCHGLLLVRCREREGKNDIWRLNQV